MKYTPSHEWIVVDTDGMGTVGITAYAVRELGEIVYVQLPPIGKMVRLGEEVVVVESTKAAVDIYAPMAGKVIEVNEALRDNLSSLHTHPETIGWLWKMEIQPGQGDPHLLTYDEYRSMMCHES
ncbi:MAG: glycine cleavage system protein GcvH [Chlamydiae bacterium]|nr:glycine cleavage system protein GcvH [Chlamydiota bacterium]